MATLPQQPAPSSLRDLATVLRHLSTHLATLSTDDPRRRQVVQDYHSQHQQIETARLVVRDHTS